MLIQCTSISSVHGQTLTPVYSICFGTFGNSFCCPNFSWLHSMFSTSSLILCSLFELLMSKIRVSAKEPVNCLFFCYVLFFNKAKIWRTGHISYNHQTDHMRCHHLGPFLEKVKRKNPVANVAGAARAVHEGRTQVWRFVQFAHFRVHPLLIETLNDENRVSPAV